MHFAAPHFLSLCLLLPVLGWLLWRYTQWQQHARRSWMDEPLLPTHTKRQQRLLYLHHLLLWLSVASLFFALARPQWGRKKAKFAQRGMDLLFLLDVSPSMRNTDLAPTRWRRSLQEIQALLPALKGDRVGLIAFDKEAGLQCPLTDDQTALRELAWQSKPGIMTDTGQGLLDAFRIAKTIFDRPSAPRNRVLLLFSDGQAVYTPRAQFQLRAQLRSFRQQGIQLYVIGAGTLQPPAHSRIQGRAFPVRPLLEGQLRQLATQSQGQYLSLATAAFGLVPLQRFLLKQQRQARLQHQREQAIERFPWFIGLACLCWIGVMGLRVRF